MKHRILIFVFITICSIDFTAAQSISQQVISSVGTFSTNSGYSLSSTTGESAAKTLEEGTIILTQGFQQTYDLTTSVIKVKDFGAEILIFPNPTLGVLFVKAPKGLFLEKLNFYLTDVTGRTIDSEIGKTWNGNMWELNLTELANGSYYLSISNEALKTIYTIKVIKVE